MASKKFQKNLIRVTYSISQSELQNALVGAREGEHVIESGRFREAHKIEGRPTGKER